MYQSEWERGMGENGYMFTCDWILLLFTWNYHNIVNWLCVLACLSCSVCVQLFATPWPVAHQTPLSMGFSRQEYSSGLPCPPPGDLPDPGIEPLSLMSPSLSGSFFTIPPYKIKSLKSSLASFKINNCWGFEAIQNLSQIEVTSISLKQSE